MKQIHKLAALAAVCLAMLLGGTVAEAAVKPTKKGGPALKSSLDTVSYALGVNIGSSLRENLKTFPNGPANINILAEIFVRTLKGDTAGLIMDNAAAEACIQTYVMAAQQKENEARKAVGEKFLAANKSKAGVKTTESGLQYKIITEGDGGEKPTDADRVKVHYTGKLLDGKVFDSSVERGEPAEFGVTQVIRGWQEALKLMTKGEKLQVWIPSDLAYGTGGAGEMIRPNSTLEFEIELLDIINPESKVEKAAEEAVNAAEEVANKAGAVDKAVEKVEKAAAKAEKEAKKAAKKAEKAAKAAKKSEKK